MFCIVFFLEARKLTQKQFLINNTILIKNQIKIMKTNQSITNIVGALLTMLFLVSATQMYAQTTRYVKPTATGTGTGLSWANASADIQAMITASVANDIVWVAAGTYKPTTNPATGIIAINDRNNTFYLKNQVKVYGGFVATETLLSQRNINANPTILSGDFGGNDVVTGTGLTLSIANNAENAYHVVMSVNDNADTILDGFTVTGGNANLSSNSIVIETQTFYGDNGGGIYNIGSLFSITNCVFSGNNAIVGGGMSNSNSGPTVAPSIVNCIFSRNNASGNGGGVLNFTAASFTNCVFNGNNANLGGGIVNFLYPAVITNCVFSGNNAFSNGGGMFNAFGATPFITNTIVWNNTSNSGVPSIGGSAPVIAFSNVEGLAAAGNNISADPLFVNAASPAGADGIFRTTDDGLRIQATSPCKDTGTNPSAPLLDILGVSIFNATKDMGAYEFAPPVIRYVKLVATGAATGLSWADASADPQAMITASAPGDIVWVAAGTYKPTTNPATGFSVANDRNNAFYLKDEVKVYGGFVGTETLLSQRSINANLTVLSGDFSGNDVVTGSGATLSITNVAENAFHVVLSVNDNINTVLDGFTIKSGNSGTSGSITVEGRTAFRFDAAGMYNIASSPSITNCIFSANTNRVFIC